MTITVTVSYPNTPGSKFDMVYYLDTHLELVGKCWGEKLISARAIKGIATPDPSTPPPYQVVAILQVESLDVLNDVLNEHGAEILGDIPNFTDVEPVIQISENLG